MAPPAATDSDADPDISHGVLMANRRLAWDRDSAMAFRELADEEPLLLLTPAATVAAPRGPSAHEESDPFQGLGEMLSGYHRRVRHVPYLYWMGMTDILYKWLDRVPTVMVVVCEPMAKSQDEVHRILSCQRQFVADALSSYNQINEGTEPAAFAVVYFGNRRFDPPSGTPMCLQCPPFGMAKLASVARDMLKA